MSDTKIVAIVNITPDSFSDGGKYINADAAIKIIRKFIADGADVIDIGAESTRPGATPLTPDEEWQRLEPVLKALPDGGQYSIDTRHAETALKSLQYKISWINDVSGFSDKAMLEAVKDSDCKLVVMHSLSVPADKNIVMPEAVDVVQEIMAFAKQRILEMQAAGINRERIIFDPGIGFGKTAQQSHDIINGIDSFFELGVPLLVGHSRKSFLGKSMDDLDAATLEMSCYLAIRGVSYLRVHSVAAHAQLLAESGGASNAG